VRRLGIVGFPKENVASVSGKNKSKYSAREDETEHYKKHAAKPESMYTNITSQIIKKQKEKI